MTAGSATAFVDLWDALLRAQALVVPDINRRVHARHGVSLSEYTVLQRIVAAAEEAPTMTQLQERAWMSAAGITRVVASLSDKGLVTRTRCDGDRRLMYASPTAAGLSLATAAEETIAEELDRLLDQDQRGPDFAVAARVLRQLGDAVT
jgi:DNA-binding MarR family transcriptional regulator